MTEAEFKANAEKKRELLKAAEELKDSTSWRSTSDKMKELMVKWKEAGYAGAENDSLWKDFKKAQQIFFDRQKEHYNKLHAEQKEHSVAKEAIISEAREAVETAADWRGTHVKLESLLARWKKAGSAGRNEDERLWNDFQEIRSGFYERRAKERESKEQALIGKRQAKGALISEIQNYTNSHDYSEETQTRVRTLINDWKAVGFCGKKDDENLWTKFQKAQDAYWFARKFYTSQHK